MKIDILSVPLNCNYQNQHQDFGSGLQIPPRQFSHHLEGSAIPPGIPCLIEGSPLVLLH